MKLNLNGGSITGAVNAVAFALQVDGGHTGYPANLSIVNVGNIRIGRIRTHAMYSGEWGPTNAGDVTIGQDTESGRAGRVEVSEIRSCLGQTGGPSPARYAGAISIYSASDVLIWDGTNPGDLNAAGSNIYNIAGNITVKHDGALLARDIMAHVVGSTYMASDVYLNGDALGNGPSGSLTARVVRTSCRGQGSGMNSGSVIITGYVGVAVADGIYTHQDSPEQFTGRAGTVTVHAAGSILIGRIQTYTWGGANSENSGPVSITCTGGPVSVTNGIETYSTNKNAGAVTIAASGDVTVRGALNLNCYGTNSLDGNLSITASGGLISVSDLDLDMVGWAKFNASGHTWVTNVLANFATAYSSGSGTVSDPYVTTQTDLRCPAGKRIYYESGVSGNAYLGGASYKVADMGGVAGSGGLLTPRLPAGTAVFFR